MLLPRTLSIQIRWQFRPWIYKNFSASRKLASLEAEARKSKKGLWAEPNPSHSPKLSPISCRTEMALNHLRKVNMAPTITASSRQAFPIRGDFFRIGGLQAVRPFHQPDKRLPQLARVIHRLHGQHVAVFRPEQIAGNPPGLHGISPVSYTHLHSGKTSHRWKRPDTPA